MFNSSIKNKILLVPALLLLLILPAILTISCNGSKNEAESITTNGNNNKSSNLKENTIHSTNEQKVYDDTFDQLWKAYRKVSGNSVLEDEAYNKFINYAQSIGHVNNWLVKVQSTSVNIDGTCIVVCVDDYKDNYYTLFITNIPLVAINAFV